MGLRMPVLQTFENQSLITGPFADLWETYFRTVVENSSATFMPRQEKVPWV